MSKIIDNIKCGNYEVVDNQGVSVTRHFTQCLEKEFADLEAKLTEITKEKIQEIRKQVCDEIRQKLKEAELMYVWKGKDKSIETIIDQIEKGGEE